MYRRNSRYNISHATFFTYAIETYLHEAFLQSEHR